MYRLTNSATELGATTAVNYLPWVLFGLIGGAVVDRVDRKWAMVHCRHPSRRHHLRHPRSGGSKGEAFK